MILAFDTATPATVVATGGMDGPVVERRHDPSPGERPGHTPQLLQLCREALAVGGCAFDDVRKIGVGVGPGSFTGLRVGVSTARALALATGADLVAISSLEALAWPLRGQPVSAVIDARRGEAFVASFGSGLVQGPEAIAADALAQLAGDGIAVGDGARLYRQQLEAAGFSVPPDSSPDHLISGKALVELTIAGATTAQNSLEPNYVRVPDATLR